MFSSPAAAKEFGKRRVVLSEDADHSVHDPAPGQGAGPETLRHVERKNIAAAASNWVNADGAVEEESIRRLLNSFYEQVRRDPELGPVFTRAIGTSDEEWAPHLARLADFWSSVMLCSGRYHGNPFLTHLRLKDLEPAMFDRWLGLFGESCNEVFDPDVATVFQQRATRIARSLRIGLFERLPARSDRACGGSTIASARRSI